MKRDDPVSPELVLVDPELAASARARLAEPANDRVAPASQNETAVLPAPDPEPAPFARPPEEPKPGRETERLWVDQEDPPTPTTRRIPALVLVLIAVAVLTGGVALAWRTSSDSSGADPGAAPSEPTSRGHSSSTTEQQARTATTSQATTSQTASTASRPRKSAPPPAPSRLFVWPVVKDANFYKVQFFRRRVLVFQALPAKARLALPMHWTYRGRHYRLLPGAYRWQVRPGFGPRTRARYGAPVTRSVWVFRG